MDRRAWQSPRFVAQLRALAPEAFAGVERLETPIIEDEKIDAAERPQQAQMASVATGERQIGEQPGDALIEHRAIVAASFVSESRSEPALAHTGRAADEE